MARNFKSLGLSFAVALAISAIAASIALSAEFHSEVGSTYPDGAAVNEQVMGTSNASIGCSTVKVVEGWLGSSTTTEVKIKPEYTNCTAQIGGNTLEARVTYTGCYLVFTNSTDASGKHYLGHLGCTEPKTEEVDIEVFSLGKYRPCVRIPAQTQTSGGLVYTNGGTPKDVVTDATIEGIEYTNLAGVCGPASVHNDGTYSGKITVTGTDSEGKQVGVWFE